jgi:hypothetical protein
MRLPTLVIANIPPRNWFTLDCQSDTRNLLICHCFSFTKVISSWTTFHSFSHRVIVTTVRLGLGCGRLFAMQGYGSGGVHGYDAVGGYCSPACSPVQDSGYGSPVCSPHPVFDSPMVDDGVLTFPLGWLPFSPMSRSTELHPSWPGPASAPPGLATHKRALREEVHVKAAIGGVFPFCVRQVLGLPDSTTSVNNLASYFVHCFVLCEM